MRLPARVACPTPHLSQLCAPPAKSSQNVPGRFTKLLIYGLFQKGRCFRSQVLVAAA